MFERERERGERRQNEREETERKRGDRTRERELSLSELSVLNEFGSQIESRFFIPFTVISGKVREKERE